MLKKVLLSLLCSVFASSFAFAGFGLSVKGGFSGGDSNFDKVDKVSVANGVKSYTENSLAWNVSAYYEKSGLFNLGEQNFFGVKIGYAKYLKSDIKYRDNLTGFTLKTDAEAFSIPLIVYYKYNLGSKWGFSFGAGASYASAEFENSVKTAVMDLSKNEDKTFIMPEFEFGAEFALSKVISFFFDMGYSFNGRVESEVVYLEIAGKKEYFYKDYSGFTTNLGIKINLF